MNTSDDQFGIVPYFKFLLLIRAAAPLAFMGISIWAISSPYLELTEIGPLVLLGLLIWAVFEGIKLFKWFYFTIGISDHGLTVGKKQYQWSDFENAWVQDAFQFQTFIQLTTKGGEIIKIPAVIQKNSFVRSALEKRLPQLDIKS